VAEYEKVGGFILLTGIRVQTQVES